VNGLRRLLRQGIDDDHQAALLESDEASAIVHFRPFIKTDRPRAEAEPDGAHREFVKYWHRWRDRPTSKNRREVLGRMADILWTVRSNSHHGRKSVIEPRSQEVAGLAADAMGLIILLFTVSATWSDRVPAVDK